MITKTAREIIKSASILANAENSGYLDFFLVTNLLNTNYKYCYNDIVRNSLQFTNELTIYNDTECELPPDCYQVISVVDKIGTPIHQSSIVGHTDGGYYIQNNVLYLPPHIHQVTVTYSTIPDTLTVPPAWKAISNPGVVPSDNKPYFVTYDEDNHSISLSANTSPFLGKSVTVSPSTFLWGDEEMISCFTRTDVSIINIQYHSPYVVVSYSDDKVFVFTGFYKSAEYNYRCIEGHETYGKCVALKTDDTTGFGMVFYDKDTSTYKYAPFVPDTILSYPNNTLFAVLEYRLAFQLAGLLGMQPLLEILGSMAEEAEYQFQTTLDRSASVHRITKHHTRGFVV